jgi:hypothetical protein
MIAPKIVLYYDMKHKLHFFSNKYAVVSTDQLIVDNKADDLKHPGFLDRSLALKLMGFETLASSRLKV